MAFCSNTLHLFLSSNVDKHLVLLFLFILSGTAMNILVYPLVNYRNNVDGYLPSDGNCCNRVYEKEFSKVAWARVTNILWAFWVLFVLNHCQAFPFALMLVVILVISDCGFDLWIFGDLKGWAAVCIFIDNLDSYFIKWVYKIFAYFKTWTFCVLLLIYYFCYQSWTV